MLRGSAGGGRRCVQSCSSVLLSCNDVVRAEVSVELLLCPFVVKSVSPVRGLCR